MTKPHFLIAIGAALAASITPVAAQVPAPVIKAHTVEINGATIRYDAVFERYDVAAPDGRIGGEVSTIAYVRHGPETSRPVIFAFNGGPGSDSVYLNVGLLGPKRLEFPSDPAAPVPSRLPFVPNSDSILDVADIVLMDPVGTGFGRLLDPNSRSYFYSVGGDGRSVADAIGAWLRKHGRTASPIYVMGESYGTTRSVVVGRNLVRSGLGANFKGLVLVSQSLPIVDTVQRRSNIVGQVVGLPTLAATAWYHKLAGHGKQLDEFVAEAKAFARSEWLPALFGGSNLPHAERHRIAAGLSGFTGVSAEYLVEHDLYLTKDTFRRVALGDRDMLLGLYDSRYFGPLAGEIDPDGVLLAAFSQSRSDMWREQFGIDIEAEPLRSQFGQSRSIATHWTYVQSPFAPTSGSNYSQLDYVDQLLTLMQEVQHLRVIVAGGWFDTTATVGADDFLMSRPGLDHSRITASTYDGGHMFYTVPHSRTAFAGQVRSLIQPGR